MSGEEISEAAESVLSKGLNFAHAPTTIPYQDFIGAIEPATRRLPQDSAEEVRSKIALALKKTTPPKLNLSREEKTALKELRENLDIIILPADKGNATVLLKRGSYTQDPNYRTIPREATDALVRRTSLHLKQSGLPPETCKGLLPTTTTSGIPLRPIVSAINAPTHFLAKHLAGLLAPFVGHNEHHVRDSTEFVKTLANFKLDTNDIL
ncbi:hypothetical protein J437_LFUL019449, partial [Ladona fulva]